MVGWITIDGWLDGQKNIDEKNRWMVEWIYICLKKTDGWLDGQENNRMMVGWIDKWMTGWIYKLIDGWMDRKQNRSMGGLI